ncbi:FMN-binding protein [Alkalicella caledoniensis]|uniref:FMN-binding protein n=1 Tax=Alkalicella caledoniensis TaxID=2731377 RepID=A0A7G9W4T2_ALKCA|nr:FMN-binding protein [Alkalicella caledoniensis]QNO13694.1 FMN-binding protein [Alkalicella caledoniensis]
MKAKLTLVSLLIVMLLVVMPGCGAGGDAQNGGDDQGRYQDGEYTGSAQGYNSEIEVRVVVSGGEITEIEVLDHEESAGIADNALAQTGQRIIEAQDTEIELITGATATSRGIRDAVANALEGTEN